MATTSNQNTGYLPTDLDRNWQQAVKREAAANGLTVAAFLGRLVQLGYEVYKDEPEGVLKE